MFKREETLQVRRHTLRRGEPEGMGMVKTSKYVKIAKAVYIAARHSGMPKYRSKYSNRIFDQWTWIALLVLRQYERKDYRGFIEWLVVATPVVEYLKLKRIPHFTSLQKAAMRLDSIAVRRIIGRFIKERNSEEGIRMVGIDSTGYRIEHASQYYQTKLTHTGKKRDICRKYLKVTISVDTKTLLIVAVKIRRGPASDQKDFAFVARKTHTIARPNIYLADKGYDAEKNHRLIREELAAFSIIPPRNEHVSIHRTKGKYRKEMKRGYNQEFYNRRVLVETVNSVVKRRFGECIYSRKIRTQNRELELRLLAYNVDRYISLFLFIILRVSTQQYRHKV